MLIAPTTKGISTATSIEAIESALRDLQSLDFPTRRAAFAAIKGVPKPYLKSAWQQVRQLAPTQGGELDCYERVEVLLDSPIECQRAITTVITSGGDWEKWLRLLLQSLERYGELGDTKIVVFCVGDCFETLRGWTHFLPNLIPIRCIARENLSSAVKGAVYSCARWIHAPSIIALEADMLCITPLAPLWTMLGNARGQAMMGVRPQVKPTREWVSQVLARLSAGESHLDFLFATPKNDDSSSTSDSDTWFRWNGGLLAGRREAWLALDQQLRAWAPFSLMWLEGGFPLWFAEEVLMNRATHSLDNPLDLSSGWNTQIGDTDREIGLHTAQTPTGMQYRVTQNNQIGETAKILHFLANGRHHMAPVNAELANHGLAH